MPSMRDIRRRIDSVASIQQITRAMKMVATAKLRRIQGRMLAMRPYADEVKNMLGRFIHEALGDEDPLLETRPVKTAGLVLIAGDRGLCGAYNINIFRHAQEFLAARKTPVKVIAVGKKAALYCRKQQMDVLDEYVDIFDDLTFALAADIARKMTGYYSNGVVDNVTIISSEFVSVIHQRVRTIHLMPFDLAEIRASSEGQQRDVYINEPSFAAVCRRLLTEYVGAQTHRVLLEAASSEHAARMTAMDSATNNAEDFIEQLRLDFNRARQASITFEILDIVGGAEALKA